MIAKGQHIKQQTADWSSCKNYTLNSQPVSWWTLMAQEYGGKECPRCGGLTRAFYFPPTRKSVGDCGILETCRLCGYEKVHLAGRWGAPIDYANKAHKRTKVDPMPDVVVVRRGPRLATAHK